MLRGRNSGGARLDPSLRCPSPRSNRASEPKPGTSSTRPSHVPGSTPLTEGIASRFIQQRITNLPWGCDLGTAPEHSEGPQALISAGPCFLVSLSQYVVSRRLGKVMHRDQPTSVAFILPLVERGCTVEVRMQYARHNSKTKTKKKRNAHRRPNLLPPRLEWR
jgi:hypothetical protein